MSLGEVIFMGMEGVSALHTRAEKKGKLSASVRDLQG